MEQATETRSKGYFRSSPSTAFDQYLQDIQKLPLISDAAEERRLARLAQKGDEAAAERLVTANLRFVISYVKKYQGTEKHRPPVAGAIGNRDSQAVRKFDPDQGVSSSHTPCGGSDRPASRHSPNRRAASNPAQPELAAHSSRSRRDDPRPGHRATRPKARFRLLEETPRRCARAQMEAY